MTAGARDTLVTLQSGVAAQDDYGGETLTWSETGKEWAQISYGRGDERRQAAAESGQQAAIFSFLSNEITRALRIKHRLLTEDGEWDIVGISPIGRDKIEATAVRSV